MSVLSAKAAPSSSSLSESPPKLNIFSCPIWTPGDRTGLSGWKTWEGSICCDMPKEPCAVKELDGPAVVTAVNIDPPFASYIYCGAIELDKLEGP